MADFNQIRRQFEKLNVVRSHQDGADVSISGNNSLDSGIHINSSFDTLERHPSGSTRHPLRMKTAELKQDFSNYNTSLHNLINTSHSSLEPDDTYVMNSADLLRASSELVLGKSKLTIGPDQNVKKLMKLSKSTCGTPASKACSRSSSDSPESENSSSTYTENSAEMLQNPYEDHIYSEIGSLSRTPLSFHSKTKRRLSWSNGINNRMQRQTSSSSSNDGYATFLHSYPKLLDLDYIPWGEQEVLNILREGRTKRFSGHITVEMMQKLSSLLHKPLIRVAREAQRFSSMFRRCTRHDLQSAMKVILSRPLYDSCLQACMKAVTLYGMKSSVFTKDSKSQHCGLKFSVGRFHRWMLDAKLAPRVTESAAIFLTACIENLLEEIVLKALKKEELGSSVLSLESLEQGLARNPDLWGIIQPFEHLVCGRLASGSLSLPSDLHSTSSSHDTSGLSSSEEGSPGSTSSGFSSGGSLSMSSGSLSFGSSPSGSIEGRGSGVPDGIECGLLATCMGSIPELGSLVSQVMVYWHKVLAPQSSTQRPMLTWSAEALHVLFHYMKCSQMVQPPQPKLHQGDVKFVKDRPYSLQPPLLEWVRVTLAFTEHRCALVVDGSDVTQAARVLLPSSDCPSRPFSPSTQSWRCTQQTSAQCQQQIKLDMAFSMLCTGRSDLLPNAIQLLGPDGVDTLNEQGLTPLMCACLHGDEAMVQMLLDAGASVNKPVPTDCQKYPGLLPEHKHWTALSFATLLAHISIIQLLLDSGANVEGEVEEDADPVCDTPLQIAAAAGHYDVVVTLLNKGADPYLTSAPKNLSGTQTGHNAFTQAAMHGQRMIFKKLLTSPKSRSEEALSLEEILAEGQEQMPLPRDGHLPDLTNPHYYYNQHFPSGSKHYHSSPQQSICSTPASEENVYMTIDEAMVQSINKRNETASPSLISTSSCSSLGGTHDFSKRQYKVLQEAMYHAAECGFLDIALELRSLGVNWSLHVWSQCLWAAHVLQRKTIIQCLLKDFLASSRHEDLNMEFVNECLPLMCHIFRNSKHEVTGQQLANILSSLYGNQPVPPIPTLRGKSIARIDPVYVNNPEMSDIQFLIDGKTFHGHKILLVNASSHMRSLLEEARQKTSAADSSSVTRVEIHDIKFKTFETMMMFLYHGGTDNQTLDTREVLDLLKASHIYKLDALKRHCEILLSRRLHVDNSAAIYKHSKVYNASELLSYCEGFFLQNLTCLLGSSDGFRKLLFSYKMLNYDLVNGLLATLSQTLEDRLGVRSSGSTLV